jgi:peptidoglycan/xylan/chitin deacetylase (PgdA/CDA1 family)
VIQKSIATWISPGGPRARLSILIFHRVFQSVDPLFPDEVDARRFNEICGWVKQWFNVVPLDAAAAHLKSGTLPERAACITFDDGYADNFHVALPILKAHGLTSTFFIATGFLDGGRMWNDTIIESIRACKLPQLDLEAMGLGVHNVASVADKQTAISALIGQIKYRSVEDRVVTTRTIAALAQIQLPDNLMMTSNEVKLMRQAGMQIGAHTVNHPILARLSRPQARREILESRETLERILGERVSLFAYPNGKPDEDYTPDTVALVRELGFDAAVSTRWGVSGADADLFQLRRFTPWDRSQLRFSMRMMSNMWTN